MKKLDIIDFLRGWSIFTIVCMHLVWACGLTGMLHKAVAFGGAGVHVFILCSGFGLYLSYLNHSLSYGEFLRRRFAKVYWPYVISVLLWGLWILFQSGVMPWRAISAHVLLYKMFSSKLDTSLCYPYWFISTIIQFYLVWPLIVRIVRIRGGIIFA